MQLRNCLKACLVHSGSMLFINVHHTIPMLCWNEMHVLQLSRAPPSHGWYANQVKKQDAQDNQAKFCHLEDIIKSLQSMLHSSRSWAPAPPVQVSEFEKLVPTARPRRLDDGRPKGTVYTIVNIVNKCLIVRQNNSSRAVGLNYTETASLILLAYLRWVIGCLCCLSLRDRTVMNWSLRSSDAKIHHWASHNVVYCLDLC